jgi:arylsulfatase A
MDQNTLILFSSDNGTTFSKGVNASFFNSTAGLRGLKMELYEGGIRVPFIAKWKGKIKESSTSDLISVQYDLMATLNDLLKLDAPINDGISYLPTLLGQDRNQKKREYTYFEYPENGGQLAIHMGEWKAVKMNVKKDKNAPWQLYNLSNDKTESNDLSAAHPDILLKLDQIVIKEHRNSHIREWEFVNPKM